MKPLLSCTSARIHSAILSACVVGFVLTVVAIAAPPKPPSSPDATATGPKTGKMEADPEAETRRELARLLEEVRTNTASGQYGRVYYSLSRILEIREAASGRRDPEYLATLGKMANALESVLQEDRKSPPTASPEMNRYQEEDRLHRLSARLAELGEIRERLADYPGAKAARAELIALRPVLPTNAVWRVADARSALVRLIRLGKLGKQEVGELAEADDLLSKAKKMGAKEDFVGGLRAARKALDVRKRLLGADDPLAVEAAMAVASLTLDKGDDDRAELLARQVLTARQKSLGNIHPGCAEALRMIAGLRTLAGQPEEAKALWNEAFEVAQKTNPPVQPGAFANPALTDPKNLPTDHGGNLTRLARSFAARGDAPRAEPLFRKVVELRKAESGEKTAIFAEALNELGVFQMDLGDFARAEPVFRQALAVRKAVHGGSHPACATAYRNLGILYERMGEFARAEPLLKLDVEIGRKRADAKPKDYAQSLAGLAFLYIRTGDYRKAEPLYRKAIELAPAKEDLDSIGVASNLGYLLSLMGKYDEAEPLLQKALEARRKLQGADHADYADCLADVAELYLASGKAKKAEPLIRESLASTRKRQEMASIVQTERQQLALTATSRHRLDLYLSVVAAGSLPTGPAYEEVLAWKGASFVRQQQRREARTDPKLAALLAESATVSGRLAAVAFAPPETKEAYPAWKKAVEASSNRQEALEAEIAYRGSEILAGRERKSASADRVLAALPADAALVDFLEYRHTLASPAGKDRPAPDTRLMAFVLRRDKPVVAVDLGAAKPVADAVEKWRTQIHSGPESAAGAELRRRVWMPLEEHLKGAKTVLLSPDGAVSRLPFAALPGAEPGTYLIEERAIAVVPAARLLAEPTVARLADPSLLLIGNVDYSAVEYQREGGSGEVRRSAARGIEGMRAFDRLPGTRAEVLSLRDSFEKAFLDAPVRIVRADGATEAAVRRLAPKHRFLHLATHGFFAPEQLRSALGGSKRGDDALGLASRQDLAGYHPGLLCGLALAGANKPPEPDRDDGILTALEVADLDLSGVEMATLSACETGLGEIAGGEGVLGLQRAFQAAGVRTVVASLWSVPDEPTRLLMERFYKNLWNAKAPMGKLEALREAQLWMLREGRSNPGVQRGMKLVRIPQPEPQPRPTDRLPPFYWAAFVLSGDWK